MSSYTVIQNNFVSGEISPMMEGRVDSAKYLTGLSICENFIPLRLGNLVKRPGTRYVSTLSSTTTARLVLFDAGSNGKYVAEFSPLLVRFWNQDGSLVEYPSGTVYSIVTPYAEDELSDLSCVMNKGVMYVVHHSHRPATIKQGTTDPFVLEFCSFTGGRTFNAEGDYPSCQAFKGGRWYLAATDNESNSIFASRTPDSTTGDRFFNFTFSEDIDGTETVLSTHAIYLQETDMYGSKINWLINQQRVLAGAGRSIWMDSGDIATPSSFDMSVTLSGGCNSTSPKAIDTYVIYAGPGGKSLNVMSYNTDNAGYVKTEISQTATHMIKSGIKDFVIINGDQGSIIWVLCNDGTLCSCTFDADSGVIGWARHPLGSGKDGLAMTVQSIEVMPGDEDESDVLWMTVKRSGNIYIEKLDFTIPDSIGESNYVDCSVSLTFTEPEASVTVEHLAGETVDAVGDNAILPVKTCSDIGSVTYDREFNTLTIGFPIAARIKNLRPELPANGSSQGKNRQVLEQTLRLYKSLGGSVECDGKTSSILPLVPGKYIYGTPFPLITNDTSIKITSRSSTDGRVIIHSDEPLPFNILAIMTKYGILEE
jgi:hypothetical protein